MAGIGQYLKDTRSELRHVAWPTQTQTIIYTTIVALVSIGVALYLGLFDYLFTGTLSRVLSTLPDVSPITITQNPASSSDAAVTPASGTTEQNAPTSPSAPSFDI